MFYNLRLAQLVDQDNDFPKITYPFKYFDLVYQLLNLKKIITKFQTLI